MSRIAIVVAAVLLLTSVASPVPVLADGETSDSTLSTWQKRTLAFQRQLSGGIPFDQLALIGSHNTYNSPAEPVEPPSALEGAPWFRLPPLPDFILRDINPPVRVINVEYLHNQV